jgi:hypothetical protein
VTTNLPTVDYLRECFAYDGETGNLIWRVRPPQHFATQRACSTFNARYAGTVAGSKSRSCVSVKVLDRLHKAHRIVWALTHGAWPTETLDHVNRDPHDNRVANLRRASNRQNQYNRGPNRNNTSGYKGVSYFVRNDKWGAQIYRDKKAVFLGLYDTPEGAAAAYDRAARELAGEYACVSA